VINIASLKELEGIAFLYAKKVILLKDLKRIVRFYMVKK
jgi:hypothetical protein